MDKVNLTEKFAQFGDIFSHRIVGEINDMYVKLEAEFLALGYLAEWHCQHFVEYAGAQGLD